MSRVWRWILLVAAAGAVTFFLARELVFGSRDMPEGLVLANGRIEGDPLYVNSKVAGRIVDLPVEEGDVLAAGALIARLDDAAARERLEQARQRVLALEARIAAAESALSLSQAQLPLEIVLAEAAVGRATAAVEASEVRRDLQARELRRMIEARASGAVPPQELDRAESELAAREQDSMAARAALRESEAALELARLGRERLAVLADEIEALRAERLLAIAAVGEKETDVADLAIRTPTGGTVVSRPASLGEVVSAGMAIVDLADLDRLFVKVYVPEAEIGKVRLGLPAQVHVDAFPGEPASGTVGFISPRAEFTPREVQTPEERVKTVFAVKVFLDANPEHRYAPGMPADVVIRWKDEVPWQPPRW
jgi:HlyD family secretion protein